MKLQLAPLLLACLPLCACTVQRTERRPVDWTTIRPSEVIFRGSLVEYDAPEPAAVSNLKTLSYQSAKDALDALDAARPAGTLLPQATTLSWAEVDSVTELTEVSFPAGKSVILNLACPGGCQMQSQITWTPNGWFSSTKALATFAGELRSGQVAQLRFETPPERAAHLNIQLSTCLALNGKCAYAASATTVP